MKKRNALYAQSGGPTAVINVSAAAVILTARKHKDRIGKIYAAREGIIGVLTEDLIDTGREWSRSIAALRHTPGAAFGSCRYKLKDLDTSRAQYERLIEVFKAHDIGYFFYNGGNDSADTCYKVSQLSETLGYPVACVHVPKTVDNDLAITDNCPGFGSVAKYVATSMREAAFDVASMAKTSTKIFVMEVMGRHAGWITAAVGLAADSDNDIPLLLLLPEVGFDETNFLARVEALVKSHGYCCIGVSEGLKTREGKFFSESGLTDAFGHAQLGGAGELVAKLIRQKLGHKYHFALADYLQRSARHIASKTDLDQSYAVGKAAVEYALKGMNAVMPAIQRVSQKPYRWKIVPAPLAEVANKEKMLPREFIAADGMGITDQCRAYLSPLIQGESPPPFKNGLPDFIRLKNAPARKKLGEFKA